MCFAVCNSNWFSSSTRVFLLQIYDCLAVILGWIVNGVSVIVVVVIGAAHF